MFGWDAIHLDALIEHCHDCISPSPWGSCAKRMLKGTVLQAEKQRLAICSSYCWWFRNPWDVQNHCKLWEKLPTSTGFFPDFWLPSTVDVHSPCDCTKLSISRSGETKVHWLHSTDKKSHELRGLWPLRRMEVTTAFMPMEKSRSSNILQTQMCWINKLLCFATTNMCCMLLDDNIEVWLHFSVFPLIFDLALHRKPRDAQSVIVRGTTSSHRWHLQNTVGCQRQSDKDSLHSGKLT